MEPFRDLGRTLLFFGALLILVGAFLYFGNKLPFRLGKLPGDIVHRGEHTLLPLAPLVDDGLESAGPTRSGLARHHRFSLALTRFEALPGI